MKKEVILVPKDKCPLDVLADALLPEWEDPELPRVIRWPLSVRAGRIIL